MISEHEQVYEIVMKKILDSIVDKREGMITGSVALIKGNDKYVAIRLKKCDISQAEISAQDNFIGMFDIHVRPSDIKAAL